MPTTFAPVAVNWENVWIAERWQHTAPVYAVGKHDDAYTDGTRRVEIAYNGDRPWLLDAAYIDGKRVAPDTALDLLEATD